MRPCLPALLLTLCCLWAGAARADLQDEVQVYDDAINAVGERGLELHVNTTPSGRRTPDYPGEVPPWHALRVTPEFSYGLRPDLELGLYIPALRKAGGELDVAGLKLRVKWLPFTTTEGKGGFGGLNLELSRLARRYSESRTSLEARFIAGWRGADWLVAVNPTIGFNLSDGMTSDRPSMDWGLKFAHDVAEGLAAGVEVYAGTGAVGRTLPRQAQDQRVYLTLDVDRKPWVFNVGIGRGLTDAADRWTLKAIFELPI